MRRSTLHEPWVNRARDLAYDAEDWVDLLFHHVQVSGGGCTALGSRILNRRLRSDRHRDIASELRELKERAAKLTDQRHYWPLKRPVDPRLTTRFVDIDCLVGFDGPMEEVTKMVTCAGGKAEFNVVSIVGMAGSGKTTLAAVVYQQLQKKKCFQLYAFVSVGQKPDAATKALDDMLSELGDDMLSELGDGHPEEPFEDDIHQLILRLREILGNKR